MHYTVGTCRFGLCNDKLVVVGRKYLGNQNLGKEGFLNTFAARSKILVNIFQERIVYDARI